MCLMPLLVLGLIWTLLAAPGMQQSPILTQESFDLEQFMGRWYEVAVLSTCPHFIQRKKENPVIITLDLKYVLSQGNFTMTASTFRNGLCKESCTDYSLTDTSGQFFHHVARFGVDVDTFVIHATDELAIILQLSTEKPSGNKTTIGKLYRKWYRVGFAYDSPGFAPYRDKVKASMGIITPLPNGNVNLTMWEPTPLGCMTKMYQYDKTSVPGQFTYVSTRHNMVKDITVVDTNYTDYALVLKHKVFQREYTQVALYGRSQRVRNDVIQKFKAFALSQGFPKEAILTPPPAENCPPSASGR